MGNPVVHTPRPTHRSLSYLAQALATHVLIEFVLVIASTYLQLVHADSISVDVKVRLVLPYKLWYPAELLVVFEGGPLLLDGVCLPLVLVGVRVGEIVVLPETGGGTVPFSRPGRAASSRPRKFGMKRETISLTEIPRGGVLAN